MQSEQIVARVWPGRSAEVPSAAAEPGRPVEVEIFGEWIAGEVAEEPLWDPSGERVRVGPDVEPATVG